MFVWLVGFYFAWERPFTTLIFSFTLQLNFVLQLSPSCAGLSPSKICLIIIYILISAKNVLCLDIWFFTILFEYFSKRGFHVVSLLPLSRGGSSLLPFYNKDLSFPRENEPVIYFLFSFQPHLDTPAL